MSGFNLPTTLSTNPNSGLISTPQLPLPGSTGANAHINPNFLQQNGLNQSGTVGANSILQAHLGASALRPQLDQLGQPLISGLFVCFLYYSSRFCYFVFI